MESVGCRDAGEAGVSAGGAVEVDGFVGAVGGDGRGEEVAYASGFEGARGLEVLEFEVDVAAGVCELVDTEFERASGMDQFTIQLRWRGQRI